MPSHTPGPWGVKDYGTGAFGITSPPSNGARVYLAHVTDGPGAEANAHVMAAAPDLLEALEGLVAQYIEIAGEDWHQHKPFIEAQAAIAKATDDERLRTLGHKRV